MKSITGGARLLGWTKQAETYNGRLAMFFVVVVLLTEPLTGILLPGQVEEMLRVGGVIRLLLWLNGKLIQTVVVVD
jgi:hypothetical protein